MKFLKGLGLFVLGLAILGIWAVSAAANFIHSYDHIAPGNQWAFVIASASAASDVLKVACFAAMVVAWRKGAYGAILACSMIWGITTAWSVRNGMGFIATVITDELSVRTSSASVHTEARDALKRQLDAAIDSQGWLQREQLSARGNKVETLSEQIDQTDSRIKKLRVELDSVQPHKSGIDPVVSMLGKLGVSQDNVVFGTALGFIALLELCSNLGPTAFGHLLGFFDTPPLGKKQLPQPKTEESVEEAEPEEEPVAALAVDNSDKRPKSRRWPRDHVLAFIASLNGANELTMLEVQRLYAIFAAGRGDQSLTRWHLGQQLGVLGVRKIETVRGPSYVFPKEIRAA